MEREGMAYSSSRKHLRQQQHGEQEHDVQPRDDGEVRAVAAEVSSRARARSGFGRWCFARRMGIR